jgi:hypothetical protein
LSSAYEKKKIRNRAEKKKEKKRRRVGFLRTLTRKRNGNGECRTGLCAFCSKLFFAGSG